MTDPSLLSRAAQLQGGADAYENLAQLFESHGDKFIAQFGHVASAEIDLANPFTSQGFGGPFNGQQFRNAIIEAIFQQCGITSVVETGAFRGLTTHYLAGRMPGKVYSCELKPRYFLYAQRKLAGLANVELQLCDSRSFLRHLMTREEVTGASVFYYLDAHWENDLPLREEIEIIIGSHPASIIAVDDFAVPHDLDYGFDDYGEGKRLTLELVAPFRGKIPNFYFPSAPGATESSIRRGCIFFAGSEPMDRKLAGIPGLRPATVRDWSAYGLASEPAGIAGETESQLVG